MKETPIKKEIVDGLIAELGIKDFAKATIREVKQVAARGLSRTEEGGFALRQGIHRLRYRPCWLCTRLRFYAGYVCFVPHLFAGLEREGYRIVY